MAIAACFFTASLPNNTNPKLINLRSFHPSSSLHLRLSPLPSPLLHRHSNRRLPLSIPCSFGGDGGINHHPPPSGGGGGDNSDDNSHNGDGDSAEDKNREEAMMVLAEGKQSLESLPKDLAAAIQAGKIPGSVVSRFLELEESRFFGWLMQFGGFRERLLADDLFLAKVGMECFVGMFTKTAAEYERRRENFFNELEVVFADVISCLFIFLLPLCLSDHHWQETLELLQSSYTTAPDNAFQVALAGTSYSLLQRLGAIARNGAKLFAVGTASSLVGTAVTNALINARKTVDKSAAGEVENVPIVSTSVAYGVYMAVSSNLRYQILAGVIEQRILEPMLHQHKIMLSALSFAVRTGNTFLGSLLWVDYARMIGIQKAQEEHKELTA
ncbi:hypothetical protein OIU77_028410 [Salix suchowensis]|uniref:Protein RETICULATA-RELATED 4, chloroplastic-like n=1 Tax=Salix suchowensis TaxID=1278906 RepID=A0ABQ9BL15_9ROSI|nr:hypothetical protein OIU77_028410 [Salix suchowensis]